jgi:hypothetical protein
MTYIPAIALVIAFGTFSPVAPAQLKVNNEPMLTEDQRTVLPLLEPILQAVLEDDIDTIIGMFESRGGRLTLPQVAGIATFSARLRDRTDIYSCMLFDTACARDYFWKLGARLIEDNQPARVKAAVGVSQVFISVKEFLEKHRNEMQVTFQRQPEGSVQAEIHIPRRPDADLVLPPWGEYESITLGFVKTGSGWKVDKLFPEPYLYLTSFF